MHPHLNSEFQPRKILSNRSTVRLHICLRSLLRRRYRHRMMWRTSLILRSLRAHQRRTRKVPGPQLVLEPLLVVPRLGRVRDKFTDHLYEALGEMESQKVMARKPGAMNDCICIKEYVGVLKNR
jgi:hypothetical protein